jgi:hypothetical protein
VHPQVNEIAPQTALHPHLAIVDLSRTATAEGRSLPVRHREPDSAVAKRLYQAGLLPVLSRIPGPRRQDSRANGDPG